MRLPPRVGQPPRALFAALARLERLLPRVCRLPLKRLAALARLKRLPPRAGQLPLEACQDARARIRRGLLRAGERPAARACMSNSSRMLASVTMGGRAGCPPPAAPPTGSVVRMSCSMR
jgi:hypothetical protein